MKTRTVLSVTFMTFISSFSYVNAGEYPANHAREYSQTVAKKTSKGTREYKKVAYGLTIQKGVMKKNQNSWLTRRGTRPNFNKLPSTSSGVVRTNNVTKSRGTRVLKDKHC